MTDTGDSTHTSDEGLPPEPHEGIDDEASPEVRAFEENQSNPIARATSDGGAPPTEATQPGELPERLTSEPGDVTAGVEISDEDLEDAVPGDTGPEHPGVRRSS